MGSRDASRDAVIGKIWAVPQDETIYIPLHHQMLGYARIRRGIFQRHRKTASTCGSCCTIGYCGPRHPFCESAGPIYVG